MKAKASGKTVAPMAPDRHYQVQDALHTLARAEQIRKDPKLMQDVRTLAADVKKAAGRAPSAPVKK